MLRRLRVWGVVCKTIARGVRVPPPHKEEQMREIYVIMDVTNKVVARAGARPLIITNYEDAHEVAECLAVNNPKILFEVIPVKTYKYTTKGL